VLYHGRNLAFHEHSTDPDPLPVNAVYYHHLDHLGTPQALTDQTGAIAWQAHYLPFGHTLDTVTDTDQPIRFPGQFVDAAAGAVYNYHRWYEPGTGRYLRSDPIGLEGGINTYLYANANAIRFSDPLGLSPLFNPNFWIRIGQGIAALTRLVRPSRPVPPFLPPGPIPNHAGTDIPIDVPIPPMASEGGGDNVIPFPGSTPDGDSCPVEDPEGPVQCELWRNSLILEEIRIREDSRGAPPGADQIAHARGIRERKRAWNRAVDEYNSRCPRKIGRRFPDV
jgi:RHS repeat-associated protein